MWGTENWGIVAIGGGASFIAAVLYMWGGTAGFGKFWRRFIASFILAVAANMIAFYLNSWCVQYLCFWPALIVGFSLPYGGSSVMEKVVKRTVFALGVLSCCALGLWAVGFSVSGWVVMTLAVITGLTSVALGVLNPFSNAPLEQFIICQVLCIYVPFWGFVR
jgi:hypothetical protein